MPTPQNRSIVWKKYVYAFLLTSVIFVTAFLASDYFNQKRIEEVKSIESRIAVDILASEMQYSLLSELSCSEIDRSFLSSELNDLGEKLVYLESNRSKNDAEVLGLKRYYTLLQLKDYLLVQRLSQRCGANASTTPKVITYFYTNTGECDDCEREGFVLTRLKQDYPELRIYSFDYNLDLSALKTFIAIYNIDNNPPAIMVRNRVYYGFKSVEDIEKIIPGLASSTSDRPSTPTTSASKSTKK